MKQYTEIADVPTDLEVVDSMGFTWSWRPDRQQGGLPSLDPIGAWGYRAPGGSYWAASVVAANGGSTAYMGPFAEVR